jgi:hypothetical protein
MPYFYISFATDEGFRGATVVHALDAEGALKEATNRELNPGGEAAIVEIPSETEAEPKMQSMINRLVGREELIAQGAKRLGDFFQEQQESIRTVATSVCKDCNK